MGGATIEDAEKALAMMKQMGIPISNPNYAPPCGLMSCDHCNCDRCPCDEEGEDECPSCGATYPDWDGEHCDDCGYGYEDEDDHREDGLSGRDIDRILETLGVPRTLYDLVKKELGL